MAESPFDPKHAVTFDLAHGLVHLEGAPSRLLVPAEALSALAAAAGDDAARAFGKALGAPLGSRVAYRLVGAEGTRTASVEAVVDHLGGELALAGLGSLSLERWGRALLLVVDASPLADSAVLGYALAAALSSATGRDVSVARLAKDGARSRYLVASASSADRAAKWIAEGVSWGDVLVRLHAPAEGGNA